MIGGLEIHPLIVHFPIALSVVGAVGAAVYVILRPQWLRWFAPILLSLALLGTAAAYFTGNAAQDRAEAIGVPAPAIAQHEETALWALGLVGLACLLTWATHIGRRGIWLSALVAAAAAGLILWNSHLGARLVFIHGAGRVQAPPGTAPQGEAPASTVRPGSE